MTDRAIMLIKKWLVSILFFTTIIAFAGIIYQAISVKNDLQKYPPSGELFSIDGKLMHIHCQGTGSPTVIIEPGIWGNEWQWQHINIEIAKITRVCGYDRPGFGYSEPTTINSITELANKLHKLLANAEITDDLVLVGHSAGGIYAREYYSHYPDNVIGMVLVESSHENQNSGEINTLNIIGSYLAPFGIIRISGRVDKEISRSKIPDEFKSKQIALYSQTHTLSAMVQESNFFNRYLINHGQPNSLGSLPLVVISRGRPLNEYVGIDPQYLENFRAYLEKWKTMQIELAQLSTDSKHVFANKSDHDVQFTQPEVIIEEIKVLIERLRKQQLHRKQVDSISTAIPQ